MTLIEELYKALAMMPCRCQWGPWHKPDNDKPLERAVIHQCARCSAVEHYETIHGTSELPTT